MKILEFLFGKKPQIFNKKGEVCHQLEEKKLSFWEKRYSCDPDKDWRNHKGRQSVFQKRR